MAKPTELPEQPTLMWRQERSSWVAVKLLLRHAVELSRASAGAAVPPHAV